MSEIRDHLGESVSDVLLILRHAAAGDFDGAVGDVLGNLRVLMGRGAGDSLVGIFDEICDRIEQAQARERLGLFLSGKEVKVARDIGWLEGFGATLWALREMQSKAIVSDETCAMYDNCVARLRENVLGVSLPSGEVVF